MNITIKKSLPSGTVYAPPSKSYGHRALICSAFSNKSTIKNISFSEDIKATMGCLESLGVKCTFKNDEVIIYGFNRKNVKNGTVLECNESGSTLRFLIPICLTLNKKIILKGSKRLLDRPIDEYRKIALKFGFEFEKNEESITVCGDMKPGEYEIDGSISSQYISGMIFALSFLNGESSLKILGKTESKPYIDLTIETLKKFGIKVTFDNNVISVFGNESTNNTDYIVEGDCSNSAYIEAFNFLNNGVVVKGINEDTIQGDYIYKEMFKDISNGIRQFDLSNCPDLAPVMFAVSSLFGGATFNGTKRLEFKESNRSMAMSEELSKFGIKTKIFEDSVVIDALNIHSPNIPLDSHNDHRIVMALSLLCAKFGGTILNAEAVNKSFPNFFEKIILLGVSLKNDA